MTPDQFPEANKTLNAPQGMKDCDPLRVWTNGEYCVSCWKMGWRERVNALLFGRVWLWVHFGQTQPPVAMAAQRTVFQEPPSKVKAWLMRARDFIRSQFRRMLPAAEATNRE